MEGKDGACSQMGLDGINGEQPNGEMRIGKVFWMTLACHERSELRGRDFMNSERFA